MTTDSKDQLLAEVAAKSSTKQAIYRNTLHHFESIKGILAELAESWSSVMKVQDPSVEIVFKDKNNFECDFKFSGDTLCLCMHTNVFTFPPQHFVQKSARVISDPMLGYFGQIQIYNFLSDSFKYNRLADEGLLLARIFVDRDSHFFVEGKQQFGFLYNDVQEQILNKEVLLKILLQSVQYCLDLDLMVPPYEQVNSVALGQFLMENGSSGHKTAKRLGFMSES
ncbi:MAG: hypothetical protein FJ343_04705 [Sphingomonadales bacterium]|nr:hypothetical protein [Sphingomonadales bacterium]